MNEVKNNTINIKELWTWIKNLVRFKENYKNDMDKKSTSEYYSKQEKSSEYEKICEKIISDFSLDGIKQLKSFLDKAITILLNSRKKVDRIKELLFKEPTSREPSSNSYITRGSKTPRK